MVDIEPYEYQRKTNIKEHNDLVAKINEIVDVINNTNLETIVPRIDKIETDISGINSTDALQWQDIESVKSDIGTITPKITKLEQDVTDINSTDAVQNTDISNLKTKDSEHDTRLGTIDTEINGINKSLVSDVAILNGTTSGNVKVRIGRKDAPSIDSDDYNIQKPTSVELVQGSAPAMVKAQITLSDGTVLISDDFMFTTEAIGQDVYISSFVFKNGNVAGTISADIGLSNGSTLTANNFVVPTDPNVTSAISDLQGKVTTVENDVSGLKTTVSGHTTSINGLDSEVSDLQTRMTAVEGGTIVGLDKLKQTVDGHTASISALDSDVADLQIDKADANNGNQSIVAGSISANNISKGGVPVATVNEIPDISGKVDKAQGSGNAGKVLGINASGNVEPMAVSGGDVWEEINMSNFPTDWANGDRIKLMLVKSYEVKTHPSSWTSAPLSSPTIQEFTCPSMVIETTLHTDSNYYNLIKIQGNSNAMYTTVLTIGSVNNFNDSSHIVANLSMEAFNGAGRTTIKYTTISSSSNNLSLVRLWRLKK